MIRRPPRSTLSSSSAASDVYKRQDCGGGMACATCHIYVNEEWFDKLPAKEDGEEDMLDMAFEPKQNSRLSCQLIVSDEVDGLVVNIPSKQG